MDTEPGPCVDALLRASRTRIDARDAELLLAYVLSREPAWLYAHGDAPLDAQAAERFEALRARREAGEPVAYLTGRRGFWTLDLEVTSDTLIPRAETERLVESALTRIPPDAATRIADLGTGSGAIALAIARDRPLAHVVATDCSDAALVVARRNAERSGIGNVEFRCGDWFAALAGERFDLIASNPPYIAEGDPHLVQGDLRHEPPPALVSGVDGLDDLRRIVRGAPAYLLPGGWLLLEHGHDQGAAVRALLTVAGFAQVQTARDLEARERITMGR
ncbi:peptide chain release factor N(5)-glutamine methyltransferase [soil metagenome]